MKRALGQDLFSGVDAAVQEASIDQLVEEQKKLAADQLLKMISGGGAMKFANVVHALLEAYMVRETNVKDICAKLAKEGVIQNTWSVRNRKPTDETIIGLC